MATSVPGTSAHTCVIVLQGASLAFTARWELRRSDGQVLAQGADGTVFRTASAALRHGHALYHTYATSISLEQRDAV